jgi:hypothetical protein
MANNDHHVPNAVVLRFAHMASKGKNVLRAAAIMHVHTEASNIARFAI